MSEKKPGFWGRLFGETPRAEPVAKDLPMALPEAPTETVPEVPASPPDHVHIETPPLAGPPEASVDFVEDIEAERNAPVAAPPPPVAQAAVAPAPAEPKKTSWLQRLTSGLKRSSDQIGSGLAAVFTKKKLDQAMLDELEDILIQADFGLDTASRVIEQLKRERFDRDVSDADVRAILAAEVRKTLDRVAQPLEIDSSHKPFVILMVGVNGTGKTTTIGKLSQRLSREGKRVMLAAGDTFRAAAIEQLQVWGQRTGAPVIARPPGSDASGLAFDAVTKAGEDGADVLIIDTAGRLQNRDELMSELEKIIRVIRKVDATAPHAVLLTLDATTGQNALSQVDIFGKRAGVTGLVMTKLDGTARGGILVAVADRFGLPVHFIGVGEGVENLEPFAAADFAEAIVGQAGR